MSQMCMHMQMYAHACGMATLPRDYPEATQRGSPSSWHLFHAPQVKGTADEWRGLSELVSRQYSE